MTIIFSIIFVLSIAGGAAWGYMHQFSVAGYIICIAVSGFIGSSIIAVIFTYLYFFPAKPDPVENINPKDTKQIKK